MKRTIKEMFMAAVLAWVVPWFLISLAQSTRLETSSKPVVETTVSTTAPQVQVIPVYTGEGVVYMTMEDYLTGVLLAELPASFHLEAKMAQVVVARTYALRTIALTDKHPGAVCCESSCCQGYCSPEEYLRLGGAPDAVSQAKFAVQQTEGLVLCYQGDLIEATYFSCSSGYTEAAVAVWGTDVPYLQSVPSPGEEKAAPYYGSVTMNPQEFSSALGVELAGSPEGWFGTVTYTQGGGVAKMLIGGIWYTGTHLRSLLNLRSTAFSITVTDEKIHILTKGHGHRVGMSQYGAEAMALAGNTWQEILAHYYPQTVIKVIGEI